MRVKHYLLFILVLSLLPLVSIFATQDLLHTHDGLVHLPRMGAYFKAFMDGQFPVRWAGDLNHGYGMPLFNFIYQLPYMLSSFFLFLGFSLASAFKVTLALSYLLSGIFMFLFARAFLNDDKKAFLVAVFYQFAPFRLVELLIRGSFGEVYTYTFLPLVLFGLIRILQKPRVSYFTLTSFSSAFLILSHNSVSLLFFGTCTLFVFLFAKTKKAVFLALCALAIGLALASFYWMPAIFEHRYTYGDLFMKNLYKNHFVPFQNFFIPNFTNANFLKTEGISVQIGFFHILAIVIAIGLLIVRKEQELFFKKITIFCLILVAASFFFMLPVSRFAWEQVSYLRQFQFPWRFLSIISFASSLLAVHYLSLSIFNKRNIFIILTILTVISTVYYWRPSLGYDKIDEGYYWNFPLNTTYYGETDVIWSGGPAKSYPKERIEIISGEGSTSGFKKKSQLQTFQVLALTDIVLVDHTQYFPGWRVFVDGKEVPIQFQDPSWKGEITFPVAKGKHDVRVSFGETKIRFITDIISVVCLVALIAVWFLKRKKII